MVVVVVGVVVVVVGVIFTAYGVICGGIVMVSISVGIKGGAVVVMLFLVVACVILSNIIGFRGDWIRDVKDERSIFLVQNKQISKVALV